jgi:hypothetical protein
MRPASQILLVENETSWKKEFPRLLAKVNEVRKVVSVEDMESFERAYKRSSDFDDVAVCLVDLELGVHSIQGANDLWGLERVLPTVRRLAPWMPIGCISTYLEDALTVGMLSASDFDGLYAKTCFYNDRTKKTSDQFNENRWREILDEWNTKRAAWMTGRSVEEVKYLLSEAQRTNIVASDGVEVALTDFAESNIKVGLALLGISGGDVSITDIVGGFSGVWVTKVLSISSDEGGEFQSSWLVKWGQPIRKLSEEAIAHARWFQRGIARELQVPQVHHNVVPWNGIGFVAYYFEANAETALKVAKEKSLDSILQAISCIASALYSGAKHKSYRARDLFAHWFNFDEKLAAKMELPFEGKPISLSQALVHGDLHLRNIMICGERPLLIDFARSQFAPVALDAAKLLTDAAVWLYSPADLGAPPSIEVIKQSRLSSLYAALQGYLTRRDDGRFLEAAIRAYAWKYVGYPDVPEATKVELRKVVALED